ncbi:hypothetical protein JJD41_23285 [Oxynema sp. CENA135]|nr:hypothetical protein [Oxynema sp. CENA135]
MDRMCDAAIAATPARIPATPARATRVTIPAKTDGVPGKPVSEESISARSPQ